jgi:hypothetical protein
VTDLTRSFSYPFRGPAWLGRVLVGALLEFVPLVMAFPLILRLLHRPYAVASPGLRLLPLVIVISVAARLIVIGYLRRVASGVLTGGEVGLPAWDRFIDDLVEGFKLAIVAIGLWLPAVAVVAGLTLLVTAVATPNLAWLPLVLVGPPAALLTLGYLPAGMLAVVAEGEMAAAFDVDQVSHRIGRVFGPYMLAFVVAIAAEIVAQLGLLVCCVGIFATRFAAHCVVVHAFASVHRDATAPIDAVPSNLPA